MGKMIDLTKEERLAARLEKYGLLPENCEAMSDDDMEKLLANVQGVLESKKREKLDLPKKGSNVFFGNVMKLGLLAIATGVAIVEENGLGLLPGSEEGEKKRARGFSLELVLHALVASSFFSDFFNECAKLLGTDEKQQLEIVNLLGLAVVIGSIYAAAQNDAERRKELIESLKSEIEKRLEAGIGFLNDRINAGRMKGEISAGVLLYMQRCDLSLKNERFDGLHESIISILNLLDIKEEQLLRGFKEIQILAQKLKTAFTTGMDDETNKITAVAQLM